MVSPLFNHLNENLYQFVEPVDETMEPYYGHHGMKEFIRRTPICNVLNFWCFARSGGFQVKFY